MPESVELQVVGAPEPRINVVPVRDTSVIVFHSLLGDPRLVELPSELERSRFIEGILSDNLVTGNAALDAFLTTSEMDARTQLKTRNAAYLRRHADNVRFLSLLIAENCNLGCSYCIAGTNMDTSRATRTTRMTWNTAKIAIDWFARRSGDATIINFSGGEPLLNWPLIELVVGYIEDNHPQLRASVTFSINTNATLVTPLFA
jgi:sulfatase maturation enzyme AslB (radical SAM superfamily)